MSSSLQKLPIRTCVYVVQTPEHPFHSIIQQQLVGAYDAKVVALDDLQFALGLCENVHIVMVSYSYERTKWALKNLDKETRDRHQLHLLYFDSKPEATPSNLFSSAVAVPEANNPKAQIKVLTRLLNQRFHSILKAMSLQQREDLRASLKDPVYFKNRFELLIAAHHNKSTFTTVSMAKMLDISVSTLERKTKEHFNTLPKQYLLEYRLLKAKQLLQYSTKKVQELAPLCGFKSSSYFSVRFADRFGMSPTQMRNELRNPMKNMAS